MGKCISTSSEKRVAENVIGVDDVRTFELLSRERSVMRQENEKMAWASNLEDEFLHDACELLRWEILQSHCTQRAAR